MKTTFKDTEGNVIRSFDDLNAEFSLDQELNIPLEVGTVKGTVKGVVIEEGNRIITIDVISKSKY